MSMTINAVRAGSIVPSYGQGYGSAATVVLIFSSAPILFRHLAHDALRVPAHLFDEVDRRLLAGLQELLALVVLDRSLEDGVLAVDDLLPLRHHHLLDVGRHRRAERRQIEEATLDPPARVLPDPLTRLAVHDVLRHLHVELAPVPRGAGDPPLLVELLEIGRMIADGVDAALRGGLDDGARAVLMLRDDVRAQLDERVGGFRGLAGVAPLPGVDDV